MLHSIGLQRVGHDLATEHSSKLRYNRSITFNSDSSKEMSILVRSPNKH